MDTKNNSKQGIKRTPVKRKPIHLDFCTCHGINVISVDGTPHAMSFNKSSDIDAVLNYIPAALPVVFGCADESGIVSCISRKIPVRVTTKEELSEDMLDTLSLVEHSGLEVSIKFLDGLMRKRLENTDSDVFDLRNMLAKAKAWKVFTSLHIEYNPHLMSKLDLLEIIDIFKNSISHLTVSFGSVLDDEYHEHRYLWESLFPESVYRFKKYYTQDVPSRSWVIKSQYKQELISDLKLFLKRRKISLEIEQPYVSEGNRIRYVKSGLCDLPFGIKSFFYKRKDREFFEVQSLEGICCPHCGKRIFG